MPNQYKPKPESSRGQSWTEEDLRKALQAVESGGRIKTAADAYGIPRSTLRNRITANTFKKGRMGPDCLLGETNEIKLCNHILQLQKAGFPITRSDLRSLAFEFAEDLKIKHNFDKEEKKAGYVWLNSFLRRHPQLSVRQSESVSLARLKALNREEIQMYFKLLDSILTKNDLLNKPSCIFNVDETGLQLNCRPEEVIAEKGSKVVASVSSSERGETITIIACCNAEGNFIPPVAIMKGVNKKQEWEDGMPPGSKIFMSQKSAYVNAELFYFWLRDCFVPRKPEGKVLLLLDGHVSHCNSVKMLEFAEENGIILLCLPSHTTHYLQPLDRAFFKSLKSFFYKAVNRWQKQNANRKVSRLQFGQLLSEGWGKSATLENAVSGFRATGIFPFNPEAVPEYAFIDIISQETSPNFNDVPECRSPGSPDRNRPTPMPTPQQNQRPGELAAAATPQPCCSKQISEESPSKLLERISPIPTVSSCSTVSFRRRIGALELTSVENIEENKAKLRKKNSKSKKSIQQPTTGKTRPRRVSKRKRKESSSSSDESVNAMPLDDSSNSSEDFSDLEYICVGCGENYKDTTSKDDWFECVRCKKWLHVSCSSFNDICNPCGWFVVKK